MTNGIRRGVFAMMCCFVASACDVWTDFRCAYGGPGCGEPMLQLLCSEDGTATFNADGEILLGKTARAELQYADDTGNHRADTLTVTSDDESVLAVTLGSDNELALEGLLGGRAVLSATVDGWEQTFAWELAVVAESADPPANEEDAGPDAAPSACEGVGAQSPLIPSESARR